MYVAFLGWEKLLLPASSRLGEGRRCMLPFFWPGEIIVCGAGFRTPGSFPSWVKFRTPGTIHIGNF
jgi:hypothetical protein